jgi:hypothetical protein
VKLKEYWPSWREARRLTRLPLADLHAPRDNALPVIVSLTSIPSRLHVLHITVRSLLNQTQTPSKILLWLQHSLAQSLPSALSELQSDVFEIRYVDLTCSHRKLIHTLAAFPEHTVVTCDDDLMYAPDWLAQLYAQHLQHPEAIVANECRQITRDEQGDLLPYKQWPRLVHGASSDRPLLPIGYAGVLYPPRALDERVGDVDLFMRLAPKADDLWFRTMAHLRGTSVRHSNRPYPKAQPIIGSQQVSLLKTNVRQDGNRLQWQALCDYFQLDMT